MLAKLWKKIALAICIIAILFNITYKLTHKTNIKSELEAVIGTEAISFTGEETTDSNVSNETEENANVQSINIEEN